MKRTVTVIGAGFSGLVTAYFLVKAGARVRVLEKEARVGGLLGTRRTEHGLVERAANGLLNSARLEALAADIGVPLHPLLPQSRARYFWREDRLRRWPLNPGESLRLVLGLITNLGHWRPRAGETVADWGGRMFGPAAVGVALTPALGGIYASNADKLSASLLLQKRQKPAAKPAVRGTVAPQGGMQDLLDGLQQYLEKQGVEIALEQQAQVQPDQPTVICTSAIHAAELLRECAPQISASLRKIEVLPIITATGFWAPSERQPQGFGCLFPRGSEFHALGVLFNNCMFAGRSRFRSETWILGGAAEPAWLQATDEELTALLEANHARLTGTAEPLLSLHLTRWPRALPHYTLELERTLATLPPLPPRLALVGNYLGQIGLAKILERAHQAATQIQEQL